MEKFIGTFKLADGKVIVSDPCYEKGTWCQGRVDNAKSGVWNCFVKEGDDGRIAELIALYSNVKDIDRLANEWEEKPFTIGVDSGQAGFFQESCFRNDATSRDYYDYFNGEEDREEGDRWYGVCCGLTLSEARAGVLEGGVVSSSGYGDGAYPLYTVEENGKIITMRLVFIGEDEDWDKDEWNEE